MKNILVTGCTGYIGSHICVELLENNYNVIGLDDFSNSDSIVISKIEQITNKKIKFYEGNLLNKELLEKIFRENNIDLVINLVAFKMISESIEKPAEYYTNNVSTGLMLISVMQKYGVKSLIFSSSVAVYGDNKKAPVNENTEVDNDTNPYGASKIIVEKILLDLYKSDNDWNIGIFRCSNPVGAHKTGLIGDNPRKNFEPLMALIAKAAVGEIPFLKVYGNDYNTKDGSCIRDYTHIVDIAHAFLKGVEKLLNNNTGYNIYNIGSGKGYSVFEMIKAFEKVNKVKIPVKIVERRPGDVASFYTDCSKAQKELNFKATLSIEEICKDAYNFALKKKINTKKS